MAKKRKKIPRPISDAVLKEFNYRCAIGGEDHPHLHHIDEDPDNNDPMNLLPLCPNCHLTDQHNPTAKIPIGILKLFRKYKDPAILKPQFRPIHDRMSYLYSYGTLTGTEIQQAQCDLRQFIMYQKAGGYYSNRIDDVNPIRFPTCRDLADTATEQESREHEKTMTLRQTVAENSQIVEGLVVEMLRYQEWPHTEPKANGS